MTPRGARSMIRSHMTNDVNEGEVGDCRRFVDALT
jgi:hypothetical protein